MLDEARTIAIASSQLTLIAPTAVARAEVAWLERRPEEIDEETSKAYRDAAERSHPAFLGRLARWRRRAGLLTERPPTGAQAVYRLELDGHLSEAAAWWEAHGCRYEAALARAESDDSAVLHRALNELNALSARPAAMIVTQRLRDRGERVPRGPRARTQENPAGLTTRELDVLKLLADGLRNREIAERLVVSSKTVDHHVSAILRKLGVRTRGEASAEASSLGLLARS